MTAKRLAKNLERMRVLEEFGVAMATPAILRIADALIEARSGLAWLEKMANQPGGILLHDGSEKGRLGLGLAKTGRTLREALRTMKAADDTFPTPRT